MTWLAVLTVVVVLLWLAPWEEWLRPAPRTHTLTGGDLYLARRLREQSDTEWDLLAVANEEARKQGTIASRRIGRA